MTLPEEKDRWEVELRQVREELHALREEQRELARSIEQLVQAFRSIATHLGITAEPYVRKDQRGRDQPPGFA